MRMSFMYYAYIHLMHKASIILYVINIENPHQFNLFLYGICIYKIAYSLQLLTNDD